MAISGKGRFSTGLTYPYRHMDLAGITPLFKVRPEREINAWVYGIGGPFHTVTIGGRNIYLPDPVFPFIMIPSEHVQVANYLRDAGKKANVDVIDYNWANLSISRAVSLLDRNSDYRFHHLNLNHLGWLPARRPHLISMYNIAHFLDRKGDSAPMVVKAMVSPLYKGGYLFSNPEILDWLFYDKVLSKTKWKRILPGTVEKR